MTTTTQSKPAHELATLNDRRRTLLAQQRDELAALDTARAAHDREASDLENREARALALGHDEPSANDKGKVTKLARQIDEHTATADRLARAIAAIDEEIRQVTITNADELLEDAVILHEQARARASELVAELHHEQGRLREAFVTAQRILATAGRNQLTARLRDVPTVERLARDGSAPQLIHPHDLTAGAA